MSGLDRAARALRIVGFRVTATAGIAAADECNTIRRRIRCGVSTLPDHASQCAAKASSHS